MKNSKLVYILVGVVCVAIIVTVVLLIVNRNQNDNDNDQNEKNKYGELGEFDTKSPNTEEPNSNKDEEESNMEKNPVVTMKIKNYGTIKLELYPEIAPITVANFVSLVQEGYYDGLKFHRIIPGFMAQGGDKSGTGSGEKEFAIKGEFSKNGVTNNLKHEKGVISMARADYTYYGKAEEGYNSAFSQFFIMFENTSSLDGLYAAFGKVIEGMDVLDKLANVEITINPQTGEESVPVNPPVIEKMTVDTFGVEYEPKRMEAFDIMAYLQQGK